MKFYRNASRGKRVLFLAAAILLFLIITNPSLLFFLPQSARDKLLDVWSGLFGNVGQIAGTFRINWVTLFRLAVIVLFMLLLTNLTKFVLEHLHPKTGKGQSICSMISSYAAYATALIGIVWGLSVLGVNLSTIFASIGIVALIVGFAAESLIEDIIIGLFLVFEDEFNVGDIVEIGGFRGKVTSIGVRVTCLQDVGGNVKIVNNSDIRNVLNRSKALSVAVCDAPVSYAANLENAETVLRGILETMPVKYPEVFKSVPNYIGVQALDASSVNLRVSAPVNEPDVFRATRLLNREIKLGFDRAGVEIPYQQIVVHEGKR